MDYMVVKCHSHFLVPLLSSGHSEFKEEKVATKVKSGGILYHWSIFVKNEDTHQFCSVV